MILQPLQAKSPPWRLQLHDAGLTLLPTEGDAIHMARPELAALLEVVPLWGNQAVLVLRRPNLKKIQLKLAPDQRQAVERWMGPPTPELLKVVLRRRYAFGIPIAILLMITSMALPGDPASGVEPLPFNPFTAVLGASLLALWIISNLKPAPALFIADSFWFLLLAASTVYDVVNGVSSTVWLLLALFAVYLAATGLKQYKRFRWVGRASDHLEPAA